MKNKEYFVFFKDLVTQAKNGIMRKEDKIKLDNIQEEANKTIVDSALSKTSQNPVQNKVIATEIETLKKSGSDSKKNVANAITGMGVPTATDADFDTITGNIEKIGGDTTISAGDILSGKVAYAKGKYIIGSMPNNGAKTAALDCGESYSIPAGYHNGAGRVSANSLASQTGATAVAADILSGKTAYVNGSKVTGNIPSKAAATYTPGTTNQEIAAGQYLSGKQTIKGDANLVAGKIKKGVSIFGVSGSFTEDATAVAGDILNGKTAYVNGSKITGNIPSKAAATYTPSTTNQEIAAGQYLSGKQTIKGDANLVAGNIKKGVSIFGINGNLEANKKEVMLGNAILSRFSNKLTFDHMLANMDGSFYKYSGSNVDLDAIKNKYRYYYTSHALEAVSKRDSSYASDDTHGDSIIPEYNMSSTSFGSGYHPMELYLLFDNDNKQYCLHIVYCYSSMSGREGSRGFYEWLNNDKPSDFEIAVFGYTNYNTNVADPETWYIYNCSAIPQGETFPYGLRYVRVVSSKKVNFYAIPLGVNCPPPIGYTPPVGSGILNFRGLLGQGYVGTGRYW